MKVLFAGPISGKSGGIAIWSQKFIKSFPNEEFEIIPIDLTTKMKNVVNVSSFYRIRKGISRFIDLRKDALNAIKTNPEIKIMHTTTSGSFGTVRDLMMVVLCHRYGIKTVMHCRYGCISEDFKSKGFMGMLLRYTMHKYDQIWVLDSRSESTLKNDPKLSEKVFLTPNSIDVPNNIEIIPKRYTKVAFIAHLFPTKGIYELVSAVKKIGRNIELSIIGPGSDDVIEQIKLIAGPEFDNRIKLLGKMNNAEAMVYLQSTDILALPTYYPSEGFPISILEAMSLGRLVISCPRAAISDMLTNEDGSKCGLLVTPQSDEAIIEALNWCLDNPKEADEMCKKAYAKVKKYYDTTVVYNIYRTLYRKLWE